MKNTMHNGNEKVELVGVPQESLAEVTGGAYEMFRTSSLAVTTSTPVLLLPAVMGAVTGAGGYAPLD
jgi:hypothetical protein